MSFSLEEQFMGFIEAPQIFVKNDIFEYPLFPTSAGIQNDMLKDLSEPRTTVLGKRMEHFFHYYITHFSSEEVLAHNRQIIEDKKTLGELDFLLKDQSTGAVSHVELIFKYYLYDPEEGNSEKDHLIGPNRRDSLNRKLHRLQKRQFPLLFHPATQKLLNGLKISPENVHQKMCFKGHVFLPKQQRNISFSEINPATISGYWIRFKDFTEEEYAKNLFFSPKKKYWPVEPGKNQHWFTYTEILQQIEPMLREQFTQLLWMQTPQDGIEKFFVVWW